MQYSTIDTSDVVLKLLSVEEATVTLQALQDDNEHFKKALTYLESHGGINWNSASGKIIKDSTGRSKTRVQVNAYTGGGFVTGEMQGGKFRTGAVIITDAEQRLHILNLKTFKITTATLVGEKVLVTNEAVSAESKALREFKNSVAVQECRAGSGVSLLCGGDGTTPEDPCVTYYRNCSAQCAAACGFYNVPCRILCSALWCGSCAQ